MVTSSEETTFPPARLTMSSNVIFNQLSALMVRAETFTTNTVCSFTVLCRAKSSLRGGQRPETPRVNPVVLRATKIVQHHSLYSQSFPVWEPVRKIPPQACSVLGLARVGKMLYSQTDTRGRPSSTYPQGTVVEGVCSTLGRAPTSR